MTECFRRRVIKLFIEKKLINQHVADNLLKLESLRLQCRFVNKTVRRKPEGAGESRPVHRSALGISGSEAGLRSMYIARQPISLKKIRFESFHGKVLFHTSYNEDVADADVLNEYFRENPKLFKATDFIALLTQPLGPL